ncbi:hypothetical protein BC834DRAFT_887454 [Gloeopeniophorella convolvens]|nr:hypothetical protein BC834DRAFT_887454 [Gloeopeniophorella convolvens]
MASMCPNDGGTYASVAIRKLLCPLTAVMMTRLSQFRRSSTSTDSIGRPTSRCKSEIQRRLFGFMHQPDYESLGVISVGFPEADASRNTSAPRSPVCHLSSGCWCWGKEGSLGELGLIQALHSPLEMSNKVSLMYEEECRRRPVKGTWAYMLWGRRFLFLSCILNDAIELLCLVARLLR